MRIAIIVLIALAVVSLVTVVLIKKSIKTTETKLDIQALANGNLTVNVNVESMIPFKVKVQDFRVFVSAGGKNLFASDAKELELSSGLNVIPITFKQTEVLTALDITSLLVKEKYVTVTGSVLGLNFSRTETL